MVLFRVLLLLMFSQSASVQGTCSTQLRLVDGSDRYEGRVEVRDGGVWRTVCDDFWDLSEAGVVCRQLGYGSARSALGNAYFGEGSSVQWKRNWYCNGDESCLEACDGYYSNCSLGESAGVICSPSSVDTGTTPTTVTTPRTASSRDSHAESLFAIILSLVCLGICCILFTCVAFVVGAYMAFEPRRPQRTSTSALSVRPMRRQQILVNSPEDPLAAYNPDVPSAGRYTNQPSLVSYLQCPNPAPSARSPVLQDSSQQPTNSDAQQPPSYPPVHDTDDDLPPPYDIALASAPPYPTGQGPPPSSQYQYHSSTEPSAPSAPAAPPSAPAAPPSASAAPPSAPAAPPSAPAAPPSASVALPSAPSAPPSAPAPR